MSHLLVTNDFPPKTGGIQSYLWELWRRLPPHRYTVLTIDHDGSAAFDEAAAARIVRLPSRMLLPSPRLIATVRALAGDVGASLVVLDPALPLGLIGPQLGLPYAVVLHGAQPTVPARLALTRPLLRRVLAGASLLVAAGGYPLAEARHALGATPVASVVVHPGVDTSRFVPLAGEQRAEARRRLGLPVEAVLVTGVSRLVPRKGFDVLIEAAGALTVDHPRLLCVIAGAGRDAPRLAATARRAAAPVRFLGRVPDEDLPALYAVSDVFAMPCRTRWLGLEQEGYGIVFNEAAAAGVPAIAGSSGGSAEAVLDEVTGLVVERPADARLVSEALRRLVDDAGLRERLGGAARRRAESELDADLLADRLDDALAAAGG